MNVQQETIVIENQNTGSATSMEEARETRSLAAIYFDRTFDASFYSTFVYFSYTFIFISALYILPCFFAQEMMHLPTVTPLAHLLFLSLLTTVVLQGVMYVNYLARKQRRYKAEVQTLEANRSQTPEKVEPAWDLARKTLEHYLNRNLEQVQFIFYLTTGISLIGFVIIAIGIWIGFNNPSHSKDLSLSYLTTGSGILIEIISTTFLLIYRSAMVQAESHVRILERINVVGMSVHILDGIDMSSKLKDDAMTLKDRTRADMASSLLLAYSSEVLNDKISNQNKIETKNKK